MMIILIFAAVLFPLPALPWIIGYGVKTRHITSASLLIGLCMAVICLGLRHSAEGTAFEGDISRYATYVDVYCGKSLFEAFTLPSDPFESYPLSTLWFWLVSQTGYDYSIQASAAFVNYSIIGYCWLDYSNREGYSCRRTLISAALIVCVFPLFYSLSALRSTTALLLQSLAIYLELYRGKRNVVTISLYVLPCFLHSTCYLVLIVRMIYQLFRESPRFVFFGGVVSIPLALAFSSALSPLFSAFNVNIIDMLSAYSEYTGTHADASSSALYYQVLKIVNIVFILMLLVDWGGKIRSLKRNRLNSPTSNVSKFYLSMLGFITGLALFIQADSYLRFTYAVFPFAVLLFVSDWFGTDEPRATAAVNGAAIKGGYLCALLSLLALHLFAFIRFVQLGEILKSAFFGMAALYL